MKAFRKVHTKTKMYVVKLTAITEKATDISGNVQLVLIILAITILVTGVYPQPMINLTKDTVSAILANH